MTPTPTTDLAATDWRPIVSRYSQPQTGRSVAQLADTLVPYALVWVLLSWVLRTRPAIAWTAGPLLHLLGAGLLVRTFIIFHDCGHGSFLRNRNACDAIGYLTGVLTFTPYRQWRHDHAVHHASAGDLDRRGVGDIWTLTVEEYRRLPWWKKVYYRAYRSPFGMLLIGPVLLFLIGQRFARWTAKWPERCSVWSCNLGIVGVALLLCWWLGWRLYLAIQLPIIAIAACSGAWLFYVQHQYEDAYWAEHDEWSYTDAALKGSSFYRLPRVLEWFTGSIGYHHVHHLSPRIPNYRLRACHEENPPLQRVPTLTFLTSLRSIRLRFWDEERRRLVGYDYLRRFKKAA